MKKSFGNIGRRATGLLLSALMGIFSISLTAYAQEEAKKDTVRPEIGKILQPVQEMLTNKKYPEALVKVREADAIAGKTPYEQYIIDRMYGAIGIGTGDTAMAAKAIEASLKSGKMEAAEKQKFTEALAGTYYKLKDYAKVVEWAKVAVTDPKVTAETRLIYAQSFYLINDFANAAKEFNGIVASMEAEGKQPPQDYLRLIASSYNKLNDQVNYTKVLEKLTVLYPTKEYWTELIYRIETQKSFAERLLLDAYRLKFALGLLSVPAEFTDMAELSNAAGLPVEAQKVLDFGFDEGFLGKDADAARQKKMRDAATKEVAEEKKRAAKGDISKARSGQALLNNGMDQVLKGEAEKGLDMMVKGMAAGNLKQPDDEKLRYGIALVFAGKKDQALEAFKGVTGKDGGADLAKLWSIYAKQKLS